MFAETALHGSLKVCCGTAASKGETGIQDAASADAADMIARAKAKAKQLEGPGISVLHEASLQPNSHTQPLMLCAKFLTWMSGLLSRWCTLLSICWEKQLSSVPASAASLNGTSSMAALTAG